MPNSPKPAHRQDLNVAASRSKCSHSLLLFVHMLPTPHGPPAGLEDGHLAQQRLAVQQPWLLDHLLSSGNGQAQIAFLEKATKQLNSRVVQDAQLLSTALAPVRAGASLSLSVFLRPSAP